MILGNGDQFLSSLIPIFKMSFFIPLFGDGSKKFQPVLVNDVVEFVMNIIQKSNITKKLFELGGPEVFTYKEFYVQIADLMNKKRVFISFPCLYLSQWLEYLKKTPFSPSKFRTIILICFR